MKDAAYIFAEHVVRVNYEDLSNEVVEATKKSILDTLGVMLGASGTSPGCRELAELVKEAGGKEESSILAFGGKVPAWMAAFVNGAMGHGLDYDDLHPKAALHPTPCTLPAGFAVAERLGGVNGKDFITALALGIDMACRMVMAVGSQLKHLDWHLSPTTGVFSCAATAGKLLNLNETEMVDAFGIALCQAGFSFEVNLGVGSNLRGVYPGFPAKAGVFSALMAQRGITGPKNSMEGQAGFFPLHFRNVYDRDILLSDLGERFEGVNVGYKCWPACGATASFIESVLKMVKTHDIKPENVEQVTIETNKKLQTLFDPSEARRTPTTPLDAKYSMPFTIAVALAKRWVAIEDYSPEGLKDPLVLQLAQRVSARPDTEERVGFMNRLVELKTTDGQVFKEKTGYLPGSPKNPLTMDVLVEKFRDCASVAARPLSSDIIERVIEMVGNLEKIEDVGEVMGLLS